MIQPPSALNETPAEAMRDLRLLMLTDRSARENLLPSKEFPRVLGVVMDWPITGHVASVASWYSGDASLYTTSGFGVLGGVGHESVSGAAINFVRTAEIHGDAAHITEIFPYPTPHRVKFYLITYHDTRVIDADFDAIKAGASPFTHLFASGQAVVSELRRVAEKKS